MKLALFGGKPIVSDHRSLKIDWPITTEADRQAILDAFSAKDFSGRGSPSVIALEEAFTRRFPGKYATALNSGTAALHAALIAVGVEPGDEVIVPNLTFVATATAVLHALAIPVFADIDVHDYNIDVDDVARRITPRTKAIIAVHLHGFPARINELRSLCDRHDIKLIEDVAQAPGALYGGKEVGMFGDAAIFSLMPQKNLPTCGECGVLLTSTLEQKNKAEMLRIYGEVLSPDKPRAYNSFSIGWNYTLGPLEAAMAVTQMDRFDTMTARIQERGRALSRALSSFPWVRPPIEAENTTGVFHFYRIGLTPKNYPQERIGPFRKAVEDALNAEGLNVRHYQNTPVSGQVIFKNKHAFGKNMPWALNDTPTHYDIENYPKTLEVLRSTLVLGAIGSTPAYLLCEGTVERYVEGFAKIDANMKELEAYADNLIYTETWDSIPVTSDSYQATYRLL